MLQTLIPIILAAASMAQGARGQKKPKGVQKQYQENLGSMNESLLPALMSYIQSIQAEAQRGGQAVSQGLSSSLGTMGGSSGALDVARLLGRGYASNQATIGAGKALWEGKKDINQQAISLATGSGPAPAAPQNPFPSDLLSLIGTYLMTGGQGAGGAGGGPSVGAGASGQGSIGLRLPPGLNLNTTGSSLWNMRPDSLRNTNQYALGRR